MSVRGAHTQGIHRAGTGIVLILCSHGLFMLSDRDIANRGLSCTGSRVVPILLRVVIRRVHITSGVRESVLGNVADRVSEMQTIVLNCHRSKLEKVGAK